MDITLALQRAVRNFALGTEALAAHLRMSVHTLNHKVSPTYPGAGCFPEEAAQICEVTGDMGPLHALGARLGHVCIPVEMCGDANGASRQQLAATVCAFGEFVVEVGGALADDKVTANELARIEREGTEALCAINALIKHARAMHRSAPREELP